ncbi:carboxymuconolactone decarboxylase family protein [bacterium]|nr:carboxymuconolactone decarboxylase family protein [bacterium]MBU1065614.1 carboxymuconolactone decarboxylase family protein [bacterium]MBU1634619.1 carboxymuconolactone decarboxylase family protein [bacterium]MBU1872494.1 carboxymuconolactone decarboxylase family protein [bacterium]
MTQQTKDKFNEERQILNELVMKYSSKISKRFLNLDAQVYQDGELDSKTKEMMGLVASLVLRCDDCIKYHLIQCHDHGVSSLELEEILSIALIVGGSITIPHIRRAVSFWDDLQ